jgi:hypothetical protein
MMAAQTTLNITNRSGADVKVYLTLGAVSGCVQDVSAIPLVSREPSAGLVSPLQRGNESLHAEGQVAADPLPLRRLASAELPDRRIQERHQSRRIYAEQRFSRAQRAGNHRHQLRDRGQCSDQVRDDRRRHMECRAFAAGCRTFRQQARSARIPVWSESFHADATIAPRGTILLSRAAQSPPPRPRMRSARQSRSAMCSATPIVPAAASK